MEIIKAGGIHRRAVPLSNTLRKAEGTARGVSVSFAEIHELLYTFTKETLMPELKRFDGIVIYLMFNDIKHHNKPHVHVFYGEFRASVAIDGTILAGELPAKQYKAVQEWLKKNEEKAYAAWNLAVQNKHFEKIDS